jgi:ubiquinone/menaquinone biosynthesis C-methylase UbiE
LWLINNGYLWRVRKNVAPAGTVLELGCAGGVAYFSQRYHMIGLDVSMASLRSAATHYEVCIRADAAQCIPLADNSIDAVASSFFWEHIPPDTKKSMLAEIRRVLRPGGRLIFLYDVETQNPLLSAMRRNSSALYNAEFIERDGHLGYQSPEQNLAAFKEAGFKVVEQLGLERTPLQSTTVYSKMKKWPAPFSGAGSALSTIDKSRVSFFSYIGLLRALDETLGKILPQRWSRMALTVCEKA